METFSAVILAGGESKRFGSPKAEAMFLGRPMLAWVVDAASAVAPEVIVVRAPHQTLPTLPNGITVLDDAAPFEGPLAGLRMGLRAASNEWVYALACDMPLLTARVLTALQSNRPARTEAVIPRIDGRLQPLAALYHRDAALVAFDAAWARDERSMQAAISRLHIVEPGPGDLGPDAVLAFRSANTREELAALEAAASAGQPPSR